LKAHHLFDCIECGACAYVCPSSIPLVQYYRAAKAEIRELEQKQQKAEHSRQRFEQRQERLRRAEERKEEERKARLEKAARARAAQAEAPIAAAAAAPASSAAGDELKRLKIDASMAQVALKKAEKQLAQHDTPELHAQVAELRAALEAAQQALADAQAAAPIAPSPPAAQPVDDAAAKKAKIEAAMLRAQLRKLEKLEAPSEAQQAELAQLREQLAAAERTLAAAASSTPAPPAGLEALKKAKVELALKRAELKKAEKAGAGEAELATLREALAAAEQALHVAEDASGKPAPELVRTDKHPIDETTRALKTELAFARAELRKLERAANADPAALDAARTRLAEAERQLAEQP
ncbi:MAG TPA: electron transport complex subunit RsxC, partial [Pseudomonas sp.]|nr:electron transport complex subunit RsxC [Pseudomonas sp.]